MTFNLQLFTDQLRPELQPLATYGTKDIIASPLNHITIIMPGDEYNSAIRGGLKLKGSKPAGIKKKKKSKPAVLSSATASSALQVAASAKDDGQAVKEKEKDRQELVRKREELEERIKLLEAGGDEQSSESKEPAKFVLIAARREMERLDGLIVAASDPTVAKVVIDDEEELEERGYKTPAQIRQEEMKRKRLEEKFEREGGVKTHKERVEELNRYLSGLSEHHDMPKIGPG